MEALEIPDNKRVFKIGEVAKLLSIEPYVLRYWETEFPEIKPRKSYSGQRVYYREDIERIQEVRDLLYESKYSIAGARTVLRGKKLETKASTAPVAAKVVVVKDASREILEVVHLRLKDLI